LVLILNYKNKNKITKKNKKLNKNQIKSENTKQCAIKLNQIILFKKNFDKNHPTFFNF
jgi:hypothetical protein